MKKNLFSMLVISVLALAFVGCANPAGENNAGGSTGGSEILGTKAPNVAKAVGDIVFNDGSATPYTAELTLSDKQKAAAIAVIFKVDGGKTLGVGLKHNRSGLAWCTKDAKAYNTNIKTIQCPASGDAGNLTFTGDTDGSDNLEQIASFLTTAGLENDTTDASKYPAFYFAKNYKTTATNLGAAYKNGWYLPTVAELFDIWKVKATVDAASSLCGESQFGNSYYWSSSQYASGGNRALRMHSQFQQWGLVRLRQGLGQHQQGLQLQLLRLCSAGFQLAKRSAADLTIYPFCFQPYIVRLKTRKKFQNFALGLCELRAFFMI